MNFYKKMEVFNHTNVDYECNPSDGTYCANYHNQTHVFMERPNDMLDPFHINPGIIGPAL